MTGREVKNDDARFWHLADNPAAPAFVRYWTRADIARACRHLLAVVPDIGRELPVSTDLLPHHDILAGDFLGSRPLGFQTKGPDFPRREPAEPLDVDGCDLRIADL